VFQAEEEALPSPAPAGDGTVAPERHRERLPMTGVSLWLLGLGVPVSLAIGLLVRYFSRRDQSDPAP
jgi:hypothetical protein